MLLLKIAFRNVRRQIGGYLIYFFTVALTVSLLFSLAGLMYSDIVFAYSTKFKNEITVICAFLSVLIVVVSALVLGYGSTFLLRRRKKEFGMYLTLGMTRSNIVTLFAMEMLFMFLFSLAAGLWLGTLVYQTIAVGVSSFMGVEMDWADYKAGAFILTVVLVGIVFLITSVAPIGYLSFEKISNLLKGGNTTDKQVKNPRLWLRIALVSLIIFVLSSIIVTVVASGHPNNSVYVFTIVGGTAIIFLSMILMYIGVLKSGTHYMLENKHFAGRGVRTFTLRQLSDRTSADSAFFGVIAVLLSIVIVGGNLFMTILGTQVAQSKIDNPYTVSVETPYDETGELTKDLSDWMRDFGTVEELRQYSVLKIDEPSLEQYFYGETPLLRESDYYALAAMAGEKAVSLDGGALMICNRITLDDLEKTKRDAEKFIGKLKWETEAFSLTFNGVSPTHKRIVIGDQNYLLAVPDTVVDTIENAKIYSSANTYCAVNYKSGSFDENAMQIFFSGKNSESVYENFPIKHGHSSFFYADVSGSFLPYLREMAAPYLMIILFVTLAFALLSMAVLALKSLASVAEDKRRYRLLYLVGASKKQAYFSLFVQIALYFFLPFAVPIILNVPVSIICIALNKMMYGSLTNLQVIGYAAMFFGILLLFYALYCTVTYLVALFDVKRELRASRMVN